MLRRATAGDSGDIVAGKQPEPGPVVLRHPEAADILHTQLELLRHHAVGLLRCTATPATPHTQQLGLQPHQRRIPQWLEQVRSQELFPSVVSQKYSSQKILEMYDLKI